MKLSTQIADAFSAWMDSVATTINSLFDRLGSQRRVQLIEEEDNTFTVRVLGDTAQSKRPETRVRIANESIVGKLPANLAAMLKGSRTELILLPSHFLFRPLELPKRATEYLEGIVRSQIDRLTPWSASEAAYSWTPPVDATNDRILLTIAATPRVKIAAYMRAVSGFGAASIAVATVAPDGDPKAAPIKVFEQRARSAINVGRIRFILVALFLLCGISALVSTGVDAVMAYNLDSEQQALLRKISSLRAAMRGGTDRAGETALQALEKRKHAKPASVFVLEALTRVLPDNTYVTEFRVDGDKLQVVGITRDAPSLIQLIEQSPHFAHATFYAPTTRTPGEAGERFHIEARINPVFTFGT
jgi:general secretion pathway protein L